MSAPEAQEFGVIDEVLGDTSNVVIMNNGMFDVQFYHANKTVLTPS